MGLCIFAIATEKYQRYMPLFSYFCFKAYPDCGVRILLLNCELDYRHVAIIKILEGMGDFKVQTVTEYLQGTKQEIKILRWVMDESFFDSYENVYITDIDKFICRERMSLEEYHLERCRKTGLPYDNIVRPNTKRLAGGNHFFRKKDYYEAAASIISKYFKLLREGALKGYKNEEILYKIVEESGLGFPIGPFYLHHGLHIGIWRAKERKNKILKRVKDGTLLLTNYREYLAFYWSLKRKDFLFGRINEIAPLRELEYMERWIEKWLPN